MNCEWLVLGIDLDSRIIQYIDHRNLSLVLSGNCFLIREIQIIYQIVAIFYEDDSSLFQFVTIHSSPINIPLD